MRIADITEFYAPTGGVRNHLTMKGRVLRDQGHDHLVIAPGKQHSLGPLDHAVTEAKGSARVVQVKGPTLPYDSNYQLLWRLDRVHRALLDFDPEVLSINSLYMATLALETLPRRLSPLRTIFWHADFIDTYLRPRIPSGVSKRVADALVEPLWAAVRKVANRSAATFVASKSQAQKLREHRVERVIFVPFGLDRSVFRSDRSSSAVRSELLGSNPNARLLVGVGRLAGEKRWDCVIYAVQRLRATEEVRLVIFGEGPELERLRAIADPRVVSLFGPERDRNRLAVVMASADLFVHGGAYETYGFSVAEAMASGLPVVVPSSGAVMDLIDPSSSETFAPGSAEACTAALKRVLGPEFNRYRACALAAAERVPDSKAQILELVRIYRALRDEARPRAVNWDAFGRQGGDRSATLKGASPAV
ncbi:MAG: glycosyltransferase [Pseudomonadota bacterium]